MHWIGFICKEIRCRQVLFASLLRFQMLWCSRMDRDLSCCFVGHRVLFYIICFCFLLTSFSYILQCNKHISYNNTKDNNNNKKHNMANNNNVCYFNTYTSIYFSRFVYASQSCAFATATTTATPISIRMRIAASKHGHFRIGWIRMRDSRISIISIFIVRLLLIPFCFCYLFRLFFCYFFRWSSTFCFAKQSLIGSTIIYTCNMHFFSRSLCDSHTQTHIHRLLVLNIAVQCRQPNM